MNILREVCPKKPTVVWKGGIGKAGIRTAVSHAASLAGSDAIWSAALAQAGAVRVENLDALVDMLVTFTQLSDLGDCRLGVVTGLCGAGGGASVDACDASERCGVTVPILSDQSISRLKRALPAAGCIYHNPVDVGSVAAVDIEAFSLAFNIVAGDPNIDVIAIHVPVKMVLSATSIEHLHTLLDAFASTRNSSGKPVIIVSQPSFAHSEECSVQRRCAEIGIPVYPSFDRAAKALSRAKAYFNRHAGQVR